LTGDFDMPEVDRLQGVIEIYNKTLPLIAFSGPTHFGPVLTKFKKNINPNTKAYHVLLLMTDGQIDDMDETRRIIVELSHLQCSVITVGVGFADFTKMVFLDSDGSPLTDAQGNKSERDIV